MLERGCTRKLDGNEVWNLARRLESAQNCFAMSQQGLDPYNIHLVDSQEEI